MRFILFLLTLLTFLGCTVSCTSSKEQKKVTIGFSQAMTTDDWRRQMDKSMFIEASLHPEINLTISDAHNDVERQIADIEGFIKEKVDIIIVSPIQSQPITKVVEKSIAAGIPVLIVDRKIEGEGFTAFLGADNIEVGRNAANYIVSNSQGNVNVVEVTGLKGSSPADERTLGFNQVMSNQKNFNIVGRVMGDWEKESVKVPLAAILSKHPDVGYIFAHNDRMAISAWETARALGLEKSIKFIGVDGLNTTDGGIQHVKDGKLRATIFYPTGGNEAIKLALRIFHKEKVNKNNLMSTIVIDQVNAEIIENQMDKIDQQQTVIDSQQNAIKTGEEEYATQNNLLRLLLVLFILVLGLAGYSIFSTVLISRKKKEVEQSNRTVTAQKDEILRMSEIAQQSTAAKINFFTGLSHEFKTPITLIMSYAESLIENHAIRNTKLTTEVRLIYSNSERLLRMINQLLDFRKIEDHKFNLRASETNLYDFSTNVMNNFRKEAQRRNIDFRLDAPKKDLTLFLDRSLMDKVYYNLISNAFKFTPDNGRIHIAIKDLETTVQIKVLDSGIGIPEHELGHVFQPFFRASNNAKNSSGIGLNLSREFILLHKGTIEVRSKHGTEFLITLLKGSSHLDLAEILKPAEQEILQDVPMDMLYGELPAAVEIQDVVREKYALLIIEDHIDLNTFLRSKLSGEYEVHLSDGSDAVEKALDIIPDIIICDVNLNGADGFQISKVLKKDLRTSHIPIIILTALSNKESVLKGLQAGVDNYLTKPFSLAILKQALNTLLYNRERLRYYYTNNIYSIDPEKKFGMPEQDFISKMNDLIRQHMTQDNSKFTVEDLAEQLHISRVQLYRKVKAILGISISDHINGIRLERAVELLRAGNLSISQIAYALGFSSPNYFSVSFKNKFGISPKDFQK